MIKVDFIYPLTAPCVSPETICRWKNMTRINKGTVAETTAETANIIFPSVCVVPRKLAILGIIVWFSLESNTDVTAKSL